MVGHRMSDQKYIISTELEIIYFWFRRHVKLLVPVIFQIVITHQFSLTRVVGYGTFSLWVIHKEGLCPSSGDIAKLMIMMMMMKKL
jgi:hypothetical protein